MKIHMAQINPTVADFHGNVSLILEEMFAAHAAGADLVVFPELVITGYYPKDLLIEPGFIEQVEAAFDRVCEASQKYPNLYAVIGLPIRNPGRGKRLFNGLRVVKNGGWIFEYHKQLLPTYNVFDENRHFEPGFPNAGTVDIGGKRVAFLVCEDIWDVDGIDYLKQPLADLEASRPDILVSINASPSNLGKRKVRHDLAKRIVATTRAALVYVNQVGGQDELVFDGSSFVMSNGGTLVAECDRFVSQGLTVDMGFVGNLAFYAPDLRHERELGPTEFYIEQIVLGLKDYLRRCGFKKVVVGSSGGIDSAVTLALAAMALGPENVTAITMPSSFSSAGSVSDSEALCEALGVRLYYHGIRELVDVEQTKFAAAFSDTLTGPQEQVKGLALENLQARLRGTILMTFSNQYGHMVLTTGNKSEIACSFFTLYGDSCGGLNLIGDLYKTEVYDVARAINARFGCEVIPAAIIDKPPSAELAPGQKDEDSLPPYPMLDLMLKGLIEHEPAGLAFVASIDANGSPDERRHLANTRRRIATSEYKRRQAPPIIRVRPRAFGAGRQIPLTAKV